MLINPFKTRTTADSYVRAYQLVLSKLALQINDSGCHAEDEKLFIGASMLFNMSLRAAVILERNYSIPQVMNLELQDRAKTIQAARFVVEHPTMFSEMFMLRGEKFAQAIEFEDEEKWVPWIGRNYVDASADFIFEDCDGPEFPFIENVPKRGRKSAGQTERVVTLPFETITFAQAPVKLVNLQPMTRKQF